MPRPIYLAVIIAGALWIGSTIPASTAHADTEPGTATEEEPSGPNTTPYTVQRGEYLEKIAKAHDINWPSIFELNEDISNPDIIYPNQELDIPDQDVPLTRQLPSETTMTVPDSYKPTVQVKTTSTSAQTTPKVQAKGNLGVGNALAYVGYPYRYGGNTPAGFDCSGFTQYIASQQGVYLPRTVMGQYSATARISKGELRPGDLVFFNAHHVGIYVGNGNIVHAATPALGVRVDSLAAAIAYNGYLGAGRL